jgi:hypothetical protein
MARHAVYKYAFAISLLVSVIQVFYATTFDFASPSWSFGSDGPPDALSTTRTITTTRLMTAMTAPPPRLLLGIFSNIDTDEALMHSEGRLREIHRRTHLAFDSVHNTTTPNRVCSLQTFSMKPVQEWKPYECQMVYAFVLGANETRSETPPSEWAKLLLSTSNNNNNNNNTTTVITPDQEALERMTVSEHMAGDFLFLNTGDRHHSYKIWSWHQFVASQQDEEWKGQFDYVAHTDTRVRIHPVEFWQNSIFTSPPKSGVYAGFLVDKAKCFKKKSIKAEWCPSLLQATTSMVQRFSVISKDLLDPVTRVNPEETHIGLQLKESLDVPLANILQQLLIPKPVIPQLLDGVRPVLTNRGSWSDYLHQWDKYKDTKLMAAKGGYQDPKEVVLTLASNATKYFSKEGAETKEEQFFVSGGARMLMGIFTMDSPVETERRATLRSTFLSYYKHSSTPNRICSLHELLSGSLPNHGAECQMAYAFVMGSNPNGPTELMDPNATFPMTLENQDDLTPLKDERDIVHLNIRENMEDGKSPTWFKYATSTVIDNHYYFDYVGKTDTDTLIFPNYLLDTTLKQFPTFPDNIRVYGGQYRQKYEWSPRRVGPIYMGGHLYWMSTDLARFVTSPEMLDRRVSVDWGIEDFSMGNFVHSHPLPIRRISISTKSHKHPLKLADEFRDEWARFQKEEEEEEAKCTKQNK